MPRRHGQIAYVAAPNTAGFISLEDIPNETKKDFEDSYGVMREKGFRGRLSVEFDTKAEAEQWTKEMASYAKQRENNGDGALNFRRSPTKGKADTVVDFRIWRDVPANAEA